MTDERLWVELTPAWRPGRWLILGSAHTHRGHFSVARVDGPGYASVNQADVATMSPEARWWLTGFLAAEEPSLNEFLGSDAELDDAADESDRARWEAWKQRWRADGVAPPLQLMPPRDIDLSAWAVPAPWVVVGGRFWVWRAGLWAPADPQPGEADEVAWPGTQCAHPEEYHSMVDLGPVLICERCHWVSA